jgi:hypothetical protein
MRATRGMQQEYAGITLEAGLLQQKLFMQVSTG